MEGEIVEAPAVEKGDGEGKRVVEAPAVEKGDGKGKRERFPSPAAVNAIVVLSANYMPANYSEDPAISRRRYGMSFDANFVDDYDRPPVS